MGDKASKEAEGEETPEQVIRMASFEKSGLILGLHPANERRHYFVLMSLIGWVQA